VRNVMVFTAGASHHAIELRWVQEVTTLGFVSAVPTAPTGLVGACNVHGAVLPVLDAGHFVGDANPSPARQGDAALILNVDGTAVALHVACVEEVISARFENGTVVDGHGRALALFEPTAALRQLVGEPSTNFPRRHE